MKEFQFINTSQSSHVKTIELNRPESRNALNAVMVDEIYAALENASTDDSIRVIVLRGAGKGFSAGADLAWMSQSTNENQDKPIEQVLSTFFNYLYHFNKPLISVVHGFAMAGALGIVATSDFVITTEEALFSFTEVLIGLVPATISPFVVRRTGEFSARRLMLSGSKINGRQAVQEKLADIVCTEEEIEEELEKITSVFKSTAPKATTICKEMIIKVADAEIGPEIMQYNASLLGEVRNSEEAREGISSFLEKRKPAWYMND
ncbi:MAG TPA: enoyl-CoA hydratase-related protein [Bacteroidales bacterium]|nr:enoyl-CoA hydratase-related protein [Bacteroidales bacterium]